MRLKEKTLIQIVKHLKKNITDPKRDFEPNLERTNLVKAFNCINYSNYICSTNNINSVNAGDNLVMT